MARQSLLRRGGSPAPVSHQNPRAPPPPGSQSRGTSPGSSVAPYRGDRSRHVSPVSHCFCFLPDREVLGSQGKALSCCALGRGPSLLSSRSTAGVRAGRPPSPCFPPGHCGYLSSRQIFCQSTWLGLIFRRQRVHTQRHTALAAALSPAMCLADGARNPRPGGLGLIE